MRVLKWLGMISTGTFRQSGPSGARVRRIG
jgi:hypothetical protein